MALVRAGALTDAALYGAAVTDEADGADVTDAALFAVALIGDA
jgi:hypothetical protein